MSNRYYKEKIDETKRLLLESRAIILKVAFESEFEEEYDNNYVEELQDCPQLITNILKKL